MASNVFSILHQGVLIDNVSVINACVCVREIEGVTANRLSPAATFLHLNPELPRGSRGILAQMLRGACCSVVMASELGYPSPAILTPQASSTSIISLWGYNKGVEEIFLPPPTGQATLEAYGWM